MNRMHLVGPRVRFAAMRLASLGLVLVVSTAAADAPKGKAKPKPAQADAGPVRVYVWDRGGLTGLYCTTAKGELATGDACAYSPRLAVQLGGQRIVVARKLHEREGMDGSKKKLASYRFVAGIKKAPIVVVESNAGMSVWAGALTAKVGPNHERLPTAPPTLVSDKAFIPPFGEAKVGAPLRDDQPNPPPAIHVVTFKSEGKERNFGTSSYTDLVLFGAFDLDRDGKTEVITLTTDDGGANVTVREFGGDPKADRDSDFRAILGG